MEPQVLDLLRLCTLRTVELTFTSFSQQSCIHNHSVYHNMSLFPSPQVSLSDVPFLGAQGGDQSPLLPIGVGPPNWGPALGPYLMLWPFLVSLVGFGHLESRNDGLKENLEYYQVMHLLI